MINSESERTGNKWWRSKRYTIRCFKKKLNETTKYLGQDLGVSTEIRTDPVPSVTTIATFHGHVTIVVILELLYKAADITFPGCGHDWRRGDASNFLDGEL